LAITDPARLVGVRLKTCAARISEFPEPARSMLVHGCVRTGVFQDAKYSERYLERVARVAALDADRAGDARLTREVARHTALWMCYQDTIQVALQKIRARRVKSVRDEARAQDTQLVQIREYLHPQIEEIVDTLPTALGRRLTRSRWFVRLVNRLTRNGLIVNTTSVVGFTALWSMAALRPLRPRSFRFGREQVAIDAWLALVTDLAAEDYALACELAECPKVLKGYGQTHAHGTQSFGVLMDSAARLRGRADGAEVLAGLRAAALADEDGSALSAATLGLLPTTS
jgi:indolepyruvate ferredoxin oxidoreductase beta subunit